MRQARDHGVDPAGRQPLGRVVQHREGRAQEATNSLRLEQHEQAVRGPAGEVGLGDPGRTVGRGHVAPQLHRGLVVRRGIGPGPEPSGRLPGVEVGAQRGRRVTGRGRMEGQVGSERPPLSGAGSRAEPGGEDPRIPFVQPHPFGRQQVLVHRVAQQRVPERQPCSLSHEDVRVQRLAKPGLEPFDLDVRHVGEAVDVHDAAAHRREPDQRAGLRAEAANVSGQEIAEGRRYARGLGGEDLLRVERVAFRATEQRGHRVAVEIATQTSGGEVAEGGRRKRSEWEEGDAVRPAQVDEGVPQGGRGVVGTVGHDEEGSSAGTADEGAREVDGVLVGPVQVLEDEDRRRPVGEVGKRVDQQSEGIGSGGVRQRDVRAGELVRRLEHRAERQRPADVHAVADAGDSPGLARSVDQGPDQGGLADARLARDEQRAGRGRAIRDQRRQQRLAPGELLVPAQGCLGWLDLGFDDRPA